VTRIDPFGTFERAEEGAAQEAIAAAAASLGIYFPPDYVEFMRLSNGGEGCIEPNGYLQLWPVETLVEENARCRVATFYPGHVLIASDGGGELIAFRRSAAGVEVVLLPMIGSAEDALVGGRTFLEFVEAYASGRIWTHRDASTLKPK
jgi:SMI1 / KNR4 family (SUKH-1)